MLIKIFCLAFDSLFGGFRDDEFRDFFKDKEIISIRDHLFTRNEIPYLTLIVKYFPHRIESNPEMKPQGHRDEKWRELISETDLGLFNILRDWRSKRCKTEGVPPYVLFTNVQLAQITKQRPQTMADLMKIEGVGKAKIDKYGGEVLNITKIPGSEDKKGE